jgi:hypothetical protein
VVERNPDKNFEVYLASLSEELEMPPLDIRWTTALVSGSLAFLDEYLQTQAPLLDTHSARLRIGVVAIAPPP